jgi:hypothetical protein
MWVQRDYLDDFRRTGNSTTERKKKKEHALKAVNQRRLFCVQYLYRRRTREKKTDIIDVINRKEKNSSQVNCLDYEARRVYQRRRRTS